MVMKKIVSIILVIVLAFSLCGCISCNCKCCEKEPVETKQEMLITNTNANDGVEIALPSPTSIPTAAPTPMIVNGVEINMDPDAWAGFDRDPYLG
jgi:hypothetical protein